MPEGCKRFWSIREHLTVDDNLVVYGCSLLILLEMQHQVPTHLHDSHQSMVRTKQRAWLTVYWPGSDNDIENTIATCQDFQDHLPSNHKEPIISKTKPSRPFQEIVDDLCSHAAQNYLILVDCCTDIILIGHNTTASHLVNAIQQSFCHTRAPDIIWSDEGPQFKSKLFSKFAIITPINIRPKISPK